MSFEIFHRYSRTVLFTSAIATGIGAALAEAVNVGAYLGGANLGGANLGGAYLRGAKGLLPNDVTPLQILGTRDYLIVREAGHITIGCEHHPVGWWEEHYAATGHANLYSDAEIVEYCEHIGYAKRWMELKGVLAL